TGTEAERAAAELFHDGSGDTDGSGAGGGSESRGPGDRGAAECGGAGAGECAGEHGEWGQRVAWGGGERAAGSGNGDSQRDGADVHTGQCAGGEHGLYGDGAGRRVHGPGGQRGTEFQQQFHDEYEYADDGSAGAVGTTAERDDGGGDQQQRG